MTVLLTVAGHLLLLIAWTIRFFADLVRRFLIVSGFAILVMAALSPAGFWPTLASIFASLLAIELLAIGGSTVGQILVALAENRRKDTP